MFYANFKCSSKFLRYPITESELNFLVNELEIMNLLIMNLIFSHQCIERKVLFLG